LNLERNIEPQTNTVIAIAIADLPGVAQVEARLRGKFGADAELDQRGPRSPKTHPVKAVLPTVN